MLRRPRSLQVKTRLKSRSSLNKGSLRRGKLAFDVPNKSITDFLAEHSPFIFVGGANESVKDVFNRIKILVELVYILKASNKIDLLNDKIFFDVFERVVPCSIANDHRLRTLSVQIVCRLTLTNDRLVFLFHRNFYIPLLRALDLVDLGEAERLESIKLISTILNRYYNSKAEFKRLLLSDERFRFFFRYSLKCFLALVTINFNNPGSAKKNDNKQHENSRLSFAALGILLEAAVYEPFCVIEFIGTNWMVECFSTFYATNARITSLMHHVLAKWLDSPHLRESAELHLVLQQLSAPLIDLGFFQHSSKETKNKDFFKLVEGLESCVHSIKNILFTWSGFFACTATCNENSYELHDSSPFRIIPYIGLSELSTPNSLKMRDVIVDVCCEFLGAPYASKTFSNWEEAILFYSRMHLPDGYKYSLRDDFVIGEMNALMASGELFQTASDLLFEFRSLVGFALIDAGIIEALCRLIVNNPEDSISIKATLLLADLLNFSSKYLPREWRLKTLTVPKLVRSATDAFFYHSNTLEFCKEELKCMRSSIKSDSNSSYTGRSLATGSGLESSVLTSLEAVSENAEEALLLLGRLDQLSEISRNRNSTSLANQLLNMKLFLLCPFQTSIPSKLHEPNFGFLPALSSVPIYNDGDVLEQCLLELSSKLFLTSRSTSTTPTSRTPSNSFRDMGDDNQPICQLEPLNWCFVDYLLQIFESYHPQVIAETLNRSLKLSDKTSTFFIHVCNHFLPSNQFLTTNTPMSVNNASFDIFHVINCGLRAFRFIAQQAFRLSNNSENDYNVSHTFYIEIIKAFAVDFCNQLEKLNLNKKTFSLKNLLNTNATYYFAIIRVLTQSCIGFKLLEKSGLFQIFFDLIEKCESAEYVKIIVSCLDYSHPGILRKILETALSSTDKKIRKWMTKFLNILIGLEDVRLNLGNNKSTSLVINENSLDNDESKHTSNKCLRQYAFGLVIRQLSDEDPKIVRCATQILLNWFPLHPEYTYFLRSVSINLLGDLGRLLEALYFSVEANVIENMKISQSSSSTSIDNIIEFWMTTFNDYYVEIIDDKMRLLTLNIKRSMNGRFSRTSTYKKNEYGSLRAAPHLLGCLARHNCGRQLLKRHQILKSLLIEIRLFISAETKKCLRLDEVKKTVNDDFDTTKYEDECVDEEKKCRRIKAALLAIGQIAGNIEFSDNDNEKNVKRYFTTFLNEGMELLNKVAQHSIWLSVRGYAFWALNFASCSKFGIIKLSEMGWECSGIKLKDTTTFSREDTFIRSLAVGQYCTSLGNEGFLRRSLSDSNIYCKDNLFDNNPPQQIIEGNNRESQDKRENSFLSEKQVMSLANYRSVVEHCNPSTVGYNYLICENESVKGKNLVDSCLIDKEECLSLVICLPSNISQICSNVFVKRTKTTLNACNNVPVLRRPSHYKLRCLYCLAGGDDSMKKTQEIPKRVQELYRQKGSEIEQLVSGLQIRIGGTKSKEESKLDEKENDDNSVNIGIANSQNRLLRIYAETPEVYEHPCLFSDVLTIIADSNLSADCRRFLQHLFWKAKY